MNLDLKIESIKALLQKIAAEHTPAVFASSFGAEDMVLVDLICKHARNIEIFTLDTGRLPEETYHLMQEVKHHYAVPIHIYFPHHAAVEKYAREYGPNAFYESVELRPAGSRSSTSASTTRTPSARGSRASRSSSATCRRPTAAAAR